MSQEDLARRSGLHRTYIGGIERGERNVALVNLVRLAGALGMRPAELLASLDVAGALADGGATDERASPPASSPDGGRRGPPH